jgi:dTDP-4-amino-4,6-dideoxy-D-galactose acyltransferase
MSQSFITLSAADNISELIERSNHSWTTTLEPSRKDSRFVRTNQTDTSVEWMLKVWNQRRGFASLSMLPWDSEQLGTTAARINYLVADGPYAQQVETKQALLKRVFSEATTRRVRHLSVRVDASDLSGLHTLEQAGFITVDSILTFSLDLSTYHSAVMFNDFTLRYATEADADSAAELAANAYSRDRFHADPSISDDRANHLHAEWIRNSCLGKAADAVLLAEDATGLLGYVTCSVRRTPDEKTVGTIVLVASAPHARGRGVGYVTTLAALEWFRSQGCEAVEVGTQLSNITASRLYQKCGFRLAGSSVSLRMIL